MMQRTVIIGFLILLSSLLPACSSIRTMGLRMGAPLFYDASNNVLDEKNLINVEKGIAGNLLLLEGLRSVRPDDDYLSATVIKAYVGFAFAVDETKYLEDRYLEKEMSVNKNQAIYHYSKAVFLGEEYLANHSLDFKMLEQALKNDNFNSVIDDQLSSNDVNLNALFFTAQALGSLINLQKEKMVMLEKLPLVKGLFDWVCEKKPEFNNGACFIFYGSYEASRPKMLGGNPEKGKKIFLDAIKKWPKNYLLREAYLEYYAIPLSDEIAFDSQVKALEMAKKEHEKELVWSPNKKFQTPKGLGLYNSIAIKRFEILKRFKEDFF